MMRDMTIDVHRDVGQVVALLNIVDAALLTSATQLCHLYQYMSAILAPPLPHRRLGCENRTAGYGPPLRRTLPRCDPASVAPPCDSVRTPTLHCGS